jgi:hypothetical protein
MPGEDFAEFRARQRRERQERQAARSAAFDAAQAAASGGTQAEIRERYEAELRARGLPVPPDDLLDVYADAIASDQRRMPMSFPALILTGIAKELAGLRTLFRNVHAPHEDH